MPKVQKDTTVRLHGDSDVVAELFDNYEGMQIITIRLGHHDGTGEVCWACDAVAVDADLARALGQSLVRMADDLEGQP